MVENHDTISHSTNVSYRIPSMTRFSIPEDDCVAGPSIPARTPASKKRRTYEEEEDVELILTAERELGEEDEEGEEEEEAEEIVEEEEEESGEEEEGSEEEEAVDDEEVREEDMVTEHDDVIVKTGTGSEISTGDASVSMILTDPDVLDCPICFDALTVPVFQCENGHIACSSCCTKIVNKCPSCAWPIGYNRCRAIEKLIECIKLSCRNTKYGCKESVFFSKKSGHESSCIFTPCSCPLRNCSFIGSSEQLYTHFSNRHRQSVKYIVFNCMKLISLEKNQNCLILIENTDGVIFVVNHHTEHLGRAVNIVCISPGSSKRRFPYGIIARDGDGHVELQSFAENIPSWSEELALRVFLMVPTDLTDSFGRLKLEVCIRAS
ncbi:unnamed protein product [Cuscuta epithymum]|uniref:RING-type E3 ubiquitin transferase n=1 Tax=Cuscuta epithymum TaxID=186058 RepID=A0AAV0G2W0_9ASTE|nr:unnamed protein product [Cuscuta epithymum]